MRFFKAKQDIPYLNGIIEKGRVLSSSKYYKNVVIVSDGTEKTKLTWMSKIGLFELFLTEKIKPLTKKELNKIKPHLKKEQLESDL